MTFKSIGIKAAALATVTVGSVVAGAVPSEAMTLFDGGVLDTSSTIGSSARVVGTNLGNSATRTITGIDFTAGANSILNPTGDTFQVTGATDGFSSYLGGTGTIQDISFVNNVSGPIANFFTITPNSTLSPGASNLVFNLNNAFVSVSNATASFTFDGTFSNALGAVLASGELSTQFNLRNGLDQASSFSFTAEAEPIPTPALLPGLMAMSVAALRKRKAGEMASTDA